MTRREVASSFKGLEIDTCRFANLPEKRRTHWALMKGKDEKLCVVKAGAGRTNRVHRMDAGWSPEAFEVCRAEGR